MTISPDLNLREAIIISIMIPKGLASAVLASIAIQMNLQHAEFIQTIVYSVILWTILISAILITLIEKTTLKESFGRMLGLGYQLQKQELQSEEIINVMSDEKPPASDE